MAEHVPKNWRDQVSVDPDNKELEKSEEALYASAKSGSLFEPEMTRKEWNDFCTAAAIEEEERKGGVPEEESALTDKQRKLLELGSQSIRNPGVRKVIEKRAELIKRLRPQCVDPTGEEMEREILEELGMTVEEFKAVSKKLGPLDNWDELEALNQVDYEEG